MRREEEGEKGEEGEREERKRVGGRGNETRRAEGRTWIPAGIKSKLVGHGSIDEYHRLSFIDCRFHLVQRSLDVGGRRLFIERCNLIGDPFEGEESFASPQGDLVGLLQQWAECPHRPLGRWSTAYARMHFIIEGLGNDVRFYHCSRNRIEEKYVRRLDGSRGRRMVQIFC